MTGLDDIVRTALQEQVQAPPAMRSPADRVIADARGVRRRRALVAVCAGVTALAVAVAGLATLRDVRDGGTPVPPATAPAGTPTTAPPASPAVRADLLTDFHSMDGWRSLHTADGRMVSLAATGGGVDTAYRTAGGWLVVAYMPQARGSLWLVRPDGSADRLVDRADTKPAVAPDGGIAWRKGDRLYVGHLAGATLVVDRSTPAPARGSPIAYTGTAVVLGYSETGGGIDRHDVWLPANGDYSPSWDTTGRVTTVYQPAPDGSLLGLVRNGSGECLTKLDPAANLRPSRTACGLPLRIDPYGLVSPGARWLAAPVFADEETRFGIIDLDRVYDHPAVAATLDVGPAGWLDATTLLVRSGDGTLMTARVGGPTVTLTPVTVPGLAPGASIQVVRRLG
ncbi:MAG TPA: hypothetical protein VFB84_19465 [Micromonosporaceae bacterium]|nr:hypothetical protein [Micromonosporaceae bacterium]